MNGYVDASLRSVLPVDPTSGRQGICFDLEDGSVVRLRLDGPSAQRLIKWMADYRTETDQSSGSSGSPHSEGSPQDGQKVVPPTISSKAETGDA